MDIICFILCSYMFTLLGRHNSSVDKSKEGLSLQTKTLKLLVNLKHRFSRVLTIRRNSGYGCLTEPEQISRFRKKEQTQEDSRLRRVPLTFCQHPFRVNTTCSIMKLHRLTAFPKCSQDRMMSPGCQRILLYHCSCSLTKAAMTAS